MSEDEEGDSSLPEPPKKPPNAMMNVVYVGMFSFGVDWKLLV